MKFQASKNALFWGIVISYLVNAVFLAACLLIMDIFEAQLTVISVSFLIFYIFVALPLKDFILSRIILSLSSDDVNRYARVERRATRIRNLADTVSFCSWLSRQWSSEGARLVIYEPENIIFFIAKSGNFRKVQFKRPENPNFISFLTQNTQARNLSDFPLDLKAYLYNRQIRSVLPIVFRDVLLGFIGFPQTLNRHQLSTLDLTGQRIAIALENERLQESMPRSEILKKEFTLAAKIENYLTEFHGEFYAGYSIKKLEGAWDKKYFSALLLSNKPGSEKESTSPFFLILCRLSHASHRYNALQLFSVQGYFMACSRRANTLEELMVNLQKALLDYENGKVMLEGFVIALHQGQSWSLQAFGSHLAYKLNSAWFWLQNTEPLGDKNWSLQESVQIGNLYDMILSIREFPLVWVVRGKT